MEMVGDIDDLPVVERDEYEVIDEVARGSLARIVAARDRRLERVVAIKELAMPHPQARVRFAREVLITSRLQHPNIIPLYEAGRWPDGTAFYAMKLVQGKSLADALDAARGFDGRLAMLSHVTDVADAMAYAHSERIIHRDLKPANVLVGPFGETMVIDWGLAKDLARDADDAPDESPAAGSGFDTSHGAVLGTPAYMPPEQAAGDAVDQRADVYALGAILYQLLAGVRPYGHLPPAKVLDAVDREPPRPLSELAPEAPAELVAIVEKAMARAPAGRYRSAREMAEELRRYATGKLVGAHHYSSFELLRRFARRTRGILLTAAIALTVLAIAGAVAVHRIASERDRASESAHTARRSQQAEAEARATAERRVDQLIFERARGLLDHDPTLSVAWLKRLREMPDGTATVIAEAAERGVARHVLRGHDDIIWKVAPVGDRIVSAGTDGLRLWTLGGSFVRQLEGHTDRVQALDTHGANLVATGSYDRSIRIWNLADASSRQLLGHRDRLKAVGFAGPDTLVSLDASGELRLWDLTTGTGILLGTGVRDGALAISESHAAVPAEDRTIAIWNLRDRSRRTLRGHRGEVEALAFSRDGAALVSGSLEGDLWIWNVATGRGRRLGRHDAHVTAVAASADGAYLVSADISGAVIRWDSSTGARHRLGSHDERVTTLAFAAGDDLVLSSSWDHTARVWRRDTGDHRQLLGHVDAIEHIAATGDRVITASWDKTLRIWPLQPPVHLTIGRHEGGVRSVDASPDGSSIASAGRDGTVGLWRADGSGGSRLRGHRDVVYRVLFAPDGSFVASSSDDETVRLWNLPDQTSRVLPAHRADVEELDLSADGHHLASGSKDDTARLWSLPAGTGRIAARHGADVTHVAFSPDSAWLASAGRDGVIELSPTRSPTAPGRRLAGHEGEVWSLAWSPDGSSLISTGTDDRVRTWDIATGQQAPFDRSFAGARHVRAAEGVIAVAGRGRIIWICRADDRSCRELNGHQAAVLDLDLAPDAKLLASAGADNTVRVWEVETGEHQVYRGANASVFDVELTGDALFGASGDGRVIRWPRTLPRPRDQLRSWLNELTSAQVKDPELLE